MGDARRLYIKIEQTRALYLFNLMSRLIVLSSDDDSLQGWGKGAAGARDLSLAGKLKHSVIIFISRAPRNTLK